MNEYLSIERVAVVRPSDKLELTAGFEAVHCSKFNAHILKKMMGIESVNFFPPERTFEFLGADRCDMSAEPLPAALHSANTGARRTVFARSAERLLSRRYAMPAMGMSSSNRCVSFFKLLDVLRRGAASRTAHYVHTAELAFSKEMRITRGLSVQGDACASLLIKKTAKPRLVVRGVAMRYDRRFYRGIWCDAAETKQYEDSYRDNMHKVMSAALNSCALALAQVDLLLPHNINSKSWRFLCDHLDFPRERVFLDNIRTEGHCFCNDLAINLSDYLAGQAHADCRYVLAVAAGAGGMFGACVLEAIDLGAVQNERYLI